MNACMFIYGTWATDLVLVDFVDGRRRAGEQAVDLKPGCWIWWRFVDGNAVPVRVYSMEWNRV